MDNEKIKKLIEPHLLYILHQEDRKFLDEICSEMYLCINDDGKEVITLKPIPNASSEKIAPQFSLLNGAFLGVSNDWDEVKKKGKKI